MTQLWRTGWMPNYMRHVVAGFLVEFLNLDWRHGEWWFHETLVDADQAINAFMWHPYPNPDPNPNPNQCAALCGLAPPPEESRCDGGAEEPSPARRLSQSNTFASKVSNSSFEISCLPGGGASAPPRPQPRSSLALATAGSGSNNFRVASSHGSVTIRSNREAVPGLL